MERKLTGLIKKSGNHYVALCLELNVASQGESIEEAKGMLQEACEEYISVTVQPHVSYVKLSPFDSAQGEVNLHAERSRSIV